MPAPTATCWNQELETMSSDGLRTIEEEKLRGQIDYVWRTSPFYRRKWDDAGVVPGRVTGLEDLPRLPFTEKAELQNAQTGPPPFGQNQCAPLHRWYACRPREAPRASLADRTDATRRRRLQRSRSPRGLGRRLAPGGCPL